MPIVEAASFRLPITATIRSRLVATVLAVSAAVVLPQFLHILGAAAGVGPGPAQALLPMHFPVLLVGLLAGPAVGMVTGLLGPLLAFALSGMPAAAMLPFMMMELATYGLVAGLLARHRMPVVWKVLVVQVAGRLARLVAIAVAQFGFGVQDVSLVAVWDAVVTGWPGIALQLCLIPLIIHWLERRHDHAGR